LSRLPRPTLDRLALSAYNYNEREETMLMVGILVCAMGAVLFIACVASFDEPSGARVAWLWFATLLILGGCLALVRAGI
jgi:lipopolysaccharide export LptBFGC system permease protein LptF